MPGEFTVEIDARGFRGDGLPPPDAPRARVAFLGDSCTFGWGLDTAETFIAQLDARMRADGEPPIELINAAIPGHSAVLGEQILRERVLPLHPDLVVLGFSANNAFRFTVLPDADRLRYLEARRLLLRSRLFSLLASRMAQRQTDDDRNPRDWALVSQVPIEDLRRVAAGDEFTAAERAAVIAARDAGAAVMFVIFPRASEVSSAYPGEDAGRQARIAAGDDSLSRGLLEVSCIDPGPPDVLTQVRDRAAAWQPVYPDDAQLRAVLAQGARAYVSDDYDAALGTFRAAVAAWPESPLAHYNLAATAFMSGDSALGHQHLNEAEQLSCSVFLRYQAIVWRLADELHVPVVDLTLPLQAYAPAPLFIDQAHPNAGAAQVIAGVLAAPIARQLGPVLARNSPN
jgi:lysophospholipase L1-like esterase